MSRHVAAVLNTGRQKPGEMTQMRPGKVKVGDKCWWQPDLDGRGKWPEREVVTVVRLSVFTLRHPLAMGNTSRQGACVPRAGEEDQGVAIRRQDGATVDSWVSRLSPLEEEPP